MRVGIYSGARNVAALALGEGFSLAGAKVAHRNVQYYRGEVEGFDLVATFALREGRAALERYRDSCPVLVVDWGYLARVNHAGESRVGHWQIGLGGLNRIPTFPCPSDRFEALGLGLIEHGGDPDGHVLICGQVPGDAAHGMTAQGYTDWLRDVVRQYPRAVYRPHPRGGVDLSGIESDTRPLQESLADARLVVTWNSNVGHEALLAGVPVVAHGKAAYAELCGEKLPGVDERRSYFLRAAYAQWTFEEMRNGKAVNFLLNHLLPGAGPVVDVPAKPARRARKKVAA